MKHLKTFLLLITCPALLAQSSLAQKYAEIRFTCKQCAGQEFRIEDFTMITSKSVTLFQGVIGNSGVVNTKVPLDFGHMISLAVKKEETKPLRYESFYLEPGDVLEVSLADSTWSAKGVHGRVYRHLSRIRQVDDERNNVLKHFYDYNRDMDSLKIQAARSQFGAYREEIDKEIESDHLLPQKFKDLLFAANAAPAKDFELFLDTRRIIVRWQSQMQEKPASFADLPERLIDKNMLLVSPSYKNSFITNLWVRLGEIMRPYDADENGAIYGYLKEKLEANPGVAVFPDYFMAQVLYLVPRSVKISFQDLQDAYNSFRAEYPGSPFLRETDSVLEEYAVLKPGSPARDFGMVSPEGDSLRLSDFTGKLVYIDIWATWCGPCREEFKYSKELSERYAGRKDLVFMYVSMDSDAGDWRRFLSDNPSLKGVHGLQQATPGDKPDPEKEKKTAYNLYKADGVPHYILIDKAGNIIDHDAPRPSQLLKSGYLDQLLKP